MAVGHGRLQDQEYPPVKVIHGDEDPRQAAYVGGRANTLGNSQVSKQIATPINTRSIASVGGVAGPDPRSTSAYHHNNALRDTIQTIDNRHHFPSVDTDIYNYKFNSQ